MCCLPFLINKTNNIDVVKSCQSFFDFSLLSDVWARRMKKLDASYMRQNMCTLWSLICYPSDNDVIVIVQYCYCLFAIFLICLVAIMFFWRPLITATSSVHSTRQTSYQRHKRFVAVDQVENVKFIGTFLWQCQQQTKQRFWVHLSSRPQFARAFWYTLIG